MKEWLEDYCRRTGKTEEEVLMNHALKLYRFLVENGFSLALMSDGTGYIEKTQN